ncbi:MAG: D-alanine--D-alanine ligase family protein [Anaerolineae bacterium]
MSNNPNRKQTVAVIFGSRSVEHDVSVVTAQQVIRALDPNKYEVLPIYITRDGKWLTGPLLTDIKTFQNDNLEELMGIKETIIPPSTGYKGVITPPVAGYLARNVLKKIDVAFPVVHGTHGEDGTLQGVFEMADVPYVGCGVLASAVANDKITTKAILKEAGIPVVDYVSFRRYDWTRDREKWIERLEELGYPMFIKPASLGSSIGIGRPADRQMLGASVDVAVNMDRRVLAERAVVGAMEINCSVMGNNEVRASVLERPVSFEDFLSYEEKYMRGGANKGMKGADRVIPAPLSPEMTAYIRQMTIDAFKAIDGRGIARIDYLVKDDQVFLNEINTLPGSLSLYLWAETPEYPMSPAMVVDELIRLAHEAHAEKKRTMYNYKSGLISQAAARGLKGTKGMKGLKGGIKR